MFKTVLVANRGAIACRIFRTLRRMGVRSAAIYSEADRHSRHVSEADIAVCAGPAPSAQSYLCIDRILDAAREMNAQAIHPGYGFLSENAAFAEACDAVGIAFVGPTPLQMRAFGLKHTARKLAQEANVPLLPGTGLLSGVVEALAKAEQIGYPVMLKSTAGGGGIGMRLCRNAAELKAAYDSVVRVSAASFGDSGLYLERFVERARHIEVQVFGDGQGSVLALGERDCSVQRRNQKVIEETPAPGLSDSTRAQLLDSAADLCRSVAYRSAGTVEYVLDDATGAFYFLEVNTRLQVEHGVTEEVTGIDLVEWMVRLAAGDLPSLTGLQPQAQGASIQVRLYAEDPGRDYQPSAGLLTAVEFPDTARVETWIESGTDVTPFYDPMLAKVIVRGKDRAEAVERMRSALDATSLHGIETNLRYLRQIVATPAFARGGVTTGWLRDLGYSRQAIEVLEPGTQTTVQDYPGRTGYWAVGVPPSGPMDPLAFRLANRICGNTSDAPALEITLTGPVLRFSSDALIAVTGADMRPELDGEPVPMWRPVPVGQGSVLRFTSPAASGTRTYLAIRGGIDAPLYLGSRSTFILGKFGGSHGRSCRSGDVLHVADFLEAEPRAISPEAIPAYEDSWSIGVLYGPHGAPDFFTEDDIDEFFGAEWTVHFNSDRTGVRLIGPRPEWARRDGGEAGLHPSNIHDNAYAIGAVDFTGDMPVLLGPDGPSLGGFVCPAVIVHAELWKLGQLRPGDKVRFRPLTLEASLTMDAELERSVQTLTAPLPVLLLDGQPQTPVLHQDAQEPGLVCRAAGDRYLLIECGPNVLDLELRFRIHALQESLQKLALPGVVDVTPGIRSIQIHYNSRLLTREALLDAVQMAERTLQDLDDLELPTRTVHLPLSWDDPATRLAIDRYMQAVRPDAPWCPSNIEFIRRINGLSSIDEVHRIVFDASYMVLGLGDVYLGAPVATPVDPRHRLVTTKYNPARTWTPENAVGIGGAYLCVYGMEGPGGYQFVGRTVQMWNTHRITADFAPGRPWLLRFFDQIRFHPVSGAELLELREAFPHGQYKLRAEEGIFRVRDYRAYLRSIDAAAAEFRSHQRAAFMAERERWTAAGQAEIFEPPATTSFSADAQIPEGCNPVLSPITASVWKVQVEPGQRVEAGQALVVLEAMKMEVLVAAPHDGFVHDLRCAPASVVTAGQQLVMLRKVAAA
ncbi:MAG TPA: urea carboxylase [Bryobacteraceae bacterium]|nr:urea carboxylase [Bryobacteraceae bacterium]